MPDAFNDSTKLVPSPNKLAFNFQSSKLRKNQPPHKTSSDTTTPPINVSSSKETVKFESPPFDLKMNFQNLPVIQLSKHKFHTSMVYHTASDSTVSNGLAEATSMTSTYSPVPIPALQQSESLSDGATLILSPSSKAVSGNYGTAISSPISHAILRKNMGTRIFYRPESVALAGVGGTAHAQSDLILDYVE